MATKGKCEFCGNTYTGRGMARHLDACPARKEAIEAGDKLRSRPQAILHLEVQDAWSSDFWLHLDVNARATLDDLDYYLRRIWLECCGHLSHFQIGWKAWRGEELPMDADVYSVFETTDKLLHLYDYGTTSETKVQIRNARTGKPLTRHPIQLMARNDMPVRPCQECGEPATFYCPECVYEHNRPGLLCDAHAEDHPCSDYGPPMRLINSPRMGMCGYDGPGEPPY